MRLRKLSLLFLAVLASGLIAAGCGDDDDDDGNGSGTTATELTIPTATDAESVEEAQQQATEAVEGAKSQAYTACVDAANQLPEPQKGQSLQACEQLK